MIGLIGMAQVLATLAYGIKGLRRGISTWDWPYFHDDPQQENTSQMERWSLNQAPTWTAPPLAIANRHYNTNNQLVQNTRYRLILAKASNFDWLTRDRHAMRDLTAVAKEGSHHWVPIPFDIPTDLPRTRDPPEHDTQRPAATTPTAGPTAEPPQTLGEEAREILAKAIRNQAEDGPSTRRAAIRAYKYLHAIVRQHGPQLQKVYEASKEHATRSKGTQENLKYRAQPQELPPVPPQLTSELLHCLSALPDPWPLAKITINLDTASQRVLKMQNFFCG